ncbi:hypothetical protein RJ40_00665 [Methanofollis aquaemaris]|uniref:Energy-coupling factor transporter transmembrane protein EcfT n=1 Tax=Methanofollis aquaemaris TaxID=126734 RepID=A0A8A3S126_9EURY|nr:hypothetical protein [Methanofollis aquaemaris]QSZ66118.1 hypothetical protein RJ40_00665 [Methanofollis aquaemaris]
MQDARLRLLCTFVLSIAAFHSVAGAALVYLWWLAFSRRTASLPSPRTVGMILLTLGLTALVTEFTGGDGISYFFRLFAVFLVAFWAYREREPGELLAVGTALFGRGPGFDLGLAGEMGVEALASLETDIARTKMALQLKGKTWGFRALVPFALTVLHAQMRRSTERAALLAVRGYRGGGSICPEFRPDAAGYGAAALACMVFILSFVPLGDVFI